MNAPVRVQATRKPLSIFAKALLEERARFRTTRHQVATQCGVQYSQIESWEKGESVPDVQTFKRLVGMFRRLAATPPSWGVPGERTTLAEKAAIDIQREVLKMKDAEVVPEPETFGAGLRRIRNENKMSLAGLGELLGLGGTSVANWESDRNAPYGKNLAKIYEVLPELKTAVSVGSVGKPMSGGKEVEPHTEPHTAPQLALVKEPEPVANTNVEPVPVAPVIVRQLAPDIAAVATRYGVARARMLVAKRELEELRGKIADAQLASQQADAAHDEALAALDAIAAEPSR